MDVKRRIERSARWHSGLVSLVVAALMSVELITAALVSAQSAAFAPYPIETQYHVLIAMRDGVRLSADIYRPTDGESHPVLFELTPYGNSSSSPFVGSVESAWPFVKRGYAVVVVDVRGQYDSEGTFDPWRRDGEDGSDVIAWIARQPWSNGKVATIGASYTGWNQWLIAKQQNPHHVAMLPYVGPSNAFTEIIRMNGAPNLDILFSWAATRYGHVGGGEDVNWMEIMMQLPLDSLIEKIGRSVPFWREWMERDRVDEYWEPMQMEGHFDKIKIPTFTVTGWWDGQAFGATNAYVNLMRTGVDPSDHMLIIGPWLHSVLRRGVKPIKLGEREFGPQSIIPLDDIRFRWLDHHMLGKPRTDLPNVMYFLTVKNEWKTASTWPMPQTEFTEFYLESGGRANTLFGDGVLRRGTPGQGRADEFTYDPMNPVIGVATRDGGASSGLRQGPVDSRSVETREDVLVYTSEPLAEGMEVTGPVKAKIYFSTDVPDTDITVKLLDVEPDGRALELSDGIMRARYRNSYSEPELLEPGRVYSIEVPMYPVSNYFKAGNRIRIEVSSSNMPLYGRNLNTGKSSETTREYRVAHTKIHHTAQYPSQMLLPVIPK